MKKANDEQKRILFSIKKEQQVIESLQKTEEKIKAEREKYREFILRQIEMSDKKRKEQREKQKAIPDIQGNEGYPRIPEPSQKEMRTTLKRLQDFQKQSLQQQAFCIKIIIKIDSRKSRKKQKRKRFNEKN